jgi:hypothetical protein
MSSVLPPSGSRARSASVLSDPSTDAGDREEEDQGDPSGFADVQEDVGGEIEDSESEEGLDGEEIYESDLEESIQGPKCAVKDWSELRKQIKTFLAKHSKSLPLTKLNQYLIISNFATLRLKGESRTQASVEIARQWHEGTGNWFARRVRALARHYQAFEELPVENRGGERMHGHGFMTKQFKAKPAIGSHHRKLARSLRAVYSKHLMKLFYPTSILF